MTLDRERWLGLFLHEAREHLREADAILPGFLEPGSDGPAALRRLMRHAHSLKGMAATMGFTPVAGTAHAMEDLCETMLREPDTRAPAELRRLSDVLAELAASIAEIESGVQAPAERAAHASAPAPERFRVSLELAPDGASLPSRAADLLRRIGALGRLLAVDPVSAGAIERGTDLRIDLELAYVGGRARLAAALDSLPGPLRASVEPAGPSLRRDRAVAFGSHWTRVRSDIVDAAAEGTLDLVADQLRARAALDGGTGDAAPLLARCHQRARALYGTMLELRLVPFETVSHRLSHSVRALATELGKPVDFRIVGGQIRIDRDLLDRLVDPLLHMARNAMDHGVEPPDERLRVGKPERGRLVLRVARAGAQVRIALEDDGRGLDPARLRATAVARGLLAREDAERLDDVAALRLITIAGFSTAPSVTGLSGRGVGMDVVREAAESAGGSLSLDSSAGEGTRVELRLPIDKSLISAIVVRRDGELLALPSLAIRRVVARGPARTDAALSIVLTGPRGDRTIDVESVLGQREIVVEPLVLPPDSTLPYSGAARLDDGSIALVLDPRRLVDL